MGRRVPAGVVGLVFACLYLLTMGRGFYTSDGDVMFKTTAALVESRTWTLDPDPGLPQIVRGHDGRFYSKYEPGLPLLGIPFYVVGDWVGRINHADRYRLAAIFFLALPALAAAGSIALLGVIGEQLAPAQPRRGLLVALCAGLGTPLWVYGRVLFPEALLALLLTATVVLVWRGAARPASLRWWLLAAGAVFGIGMLTRVGFMIYALPLAVLVLRVGPAGVSRYRRWRHLAYFSAGVLPGLAGVLGHNALRFGDLLHTGYAGEGFSTAPWLGIGGLLLSPGKGVFVFAPVLVVSAALWPRFRREHPALGDFLAVAWFVALGVYGSWWAWGGGWCWGPRFLVPLVPLSCLPLLAIPPRRSWLVALLGTTCLGVVVNGLGIITDEVAHYASVAAHHANPEMAVAFSVHDSQLVGAARALVAGRTESLGLFHLEAVGLPVTWTVGVPLLLLAGLVAGARQMFLVWREAQAVTTTNSRFARTKY